MAKILIIDTQRSIRNVLKEKLEFEGYSVEVCEALAEALALSKETIFNIVITEDTFFTEYMEGKEYFHKECSFIVTSNSPSITDVVGIMRMGAVDLIAKPIDMNKLLGSIRKILSKSGDQSGVVVAPMPEKRRKTPKEQNGNDTIVGNSICVKHLKSLIGKVAPSEARVLIMGPNGTGKELVARQLHDFSSRSAAPFVEVNCAAIPSELIESELFGHEKGAFTSAIRQRKGKFEQANGGTLFLDEIGDMSLSAQAKVLRVLQESRLSRVGSDKDITVDVRIVAATNKDLRKEISNGNFREDLYHRLSVIVIPVPPLSERIDDIPILVNHFVDQISEEYGVVPKKVDKEALDRLKKMDWSGNIRELRNVVERLIILSGGDKITSLDVNTYAANTF